ncbi:MAG: SDR family oxidoreductase [Rhodospirillaceae bacterium]|nr:SDR family oxidoreductase [Rhodospirillaceae bacterium]
MTTYVHDLFSLAGRVALVTGGSSGIGRHMAFTLARAGADVVVLARRADELQKTVDAINSGGAGNAAALSVDLGDRDALAGIAADAATPFGAPDIIVNAAGINLREAPDDITWDSWDKTLDLNLSVPFFLTRALVPGMREKGLGNVINIASLQSYRAFPNGMAYGASKGGIAQLTRAMAEAWSVDRVSVNAIAPGFFPTELTQPVYENPEMLTHNAAMTAIGRNGEMADLEGATIFLASKASAYITGQIISVDGGFTAK